MAPSSGLSGPEEPDGSYIPIVWTACYVTSWPTSPHPILTRADGWIGVSEEHLIKKEKTPVPSRTPEEWREWHWPTLDTQTHSKKRPKWCGGATHSFRGLGLTNQPDGKRAAIFFFFWLRYHAMVMFVWCVKEPQRGLISREMGLLYERFTAWVADWGDTTDSSEIECRLKLF